MRTIGLSLLLALLTAILLILSVPKFDIGILAAVALAPLLVAVAREPRALRRFLVGWAAGIVYWFGVCYWIQFVLAVHGGLGEAGGWGAFLLFCLAKGLHLAVFGYLAGYLMEKPWAIPAVAALWTGIERTHGPLGFAWFTLGNAGIDMSVPLRLVPFAGVYGISFIFASMSVALAVAFLRRPRWELAWLLPLVGIYLLPAPPSYRRGVESAVIAQPNIPQDREWTPEAYTMAVQKLTFGSLQASLSPGRKPPRFIAWPEAPAPFYYEENDQFREAVNDLARTAHAGVIVGNVTHTPQGAPLNSATMVSADGTLVGRYDKIFLVPFGEFIPPLFNFVQKISSEAGDFTPGSKVVVFPVDGHQLGAFICYESVFPHLVRQFADSGADVLLNISNDGYFGHSAAREQHLKIARMRAVENRRWVIRATNDGISATIDPAGRITHSLPPYIETAKRTYFNFVSEKTAYTEYGDWFAWSCLAAGLIAVGAAQFPRRRHY